MFSVDQTQTSDPQDVKYSGDIACDKFAMIRDSSMNAPNWWEASKKSNSNSFEPLPMNSSESTREIGALEPVAQRELPPPLTFFEGQQYEGMSFHMLQPMRPHSHFQSDTLAVECNMLSAQQIKEYTTPSDPLEITKLTPQQIKDKLLTFDFALENLKHQQKLLPAAPTGNAPDVNAAERQRLQERVELYESMMTELTKKLTEMKRLVSNQSESLQVPVFGVNHDVNIEQLRLHVPTFGDSTSNICISTFWKKLLTFVESQSYSEQGIKTALSNLLQGNAFDLFFTIRHKSLHDILEALEGSFSDHKTILDLDLKLQSLKRERSQTLTNFMNEVHTLIMKTESLRPVGQREQYANFILVQKLRENASPKAQVEIQNALETSIRNGIQLDYTSLLDIAKRAEYRTRIQASANNIYEHQNAPSPRSTTIHSAVVEPNSPNGGKQRFERSPSPYSPTKEWDREYVSDSDDWNNIEVDDFDYSRGRENEYQLDRSPSPT